VFSIIHLKAGPIFLIIVAKLIQSMLRSVNVRRSRILKGSQIECNRQEAAIFLHQRNYVERVSARFGMSSCKPATTPTELNHPLHKPEVLNNEVKQGLPHQEAIGSLLFCAMGSRPDISYSLSVLSKYASCPRRAHWGAIKTVMRYLRHTTDHGLLYKKIDDAKLVCNTNADWARDQESR